MIFKSFVARLLIILQIYSNLFQGVAHAADLTDYPIRNEIHLRSTINQYGDVRLALGTDNGSDDPEILDIINIPGLLKPLKMVTEVDEDNLSEYSDLSTDDEFETNDPPLNGAKLNHTSAFEVFTIQGLRISISNTGAMTIEGSAHLNSKPIFLSSETSITLDNLQAKALKITAPRMVNHGTSTLDCLRLGTLGKDEESTQKFINYGDLTAKELFLNNLNSDNQGKIAALSCGIYGAVEHAGAIEADRLILTQKSALKFTKDTKAEIKALFLSKASHLESSDSSGKVNIDVLESLKGRLTNLGTLVISEIAEGSYFQAITNRHFIGVGNGDVDTDRFENSGIFGIKQGLLVVNSCTNSGSLTSNELTVATEFTNSEDGIVTTSAISGEGELLNQGKIVTADALELGLRQLVNQGSVQAQTITGLATLEKLTNGSEARIEAEKALSFTDSTQVINDGMITAKKMTLVGDQTSQNGNLIAKTLDIVGGGTFENHGEIDAEQAITLALTKLINRGSMISPVFNISKELTRLENTKGAVLDLWGDGLEPSAQATQALINSLKEYTKFTEHKIATTERLLARKSMITNLLKLEEQQLKEVIQANKACFDTLFGKTLVLGWALLQNREDLSHLFAKPESFDYGAYFKEKVDADLISQLGEVDKVIHELSSLDAREHYRFYFHSIQLVWPANDLKEEAAFKKGFLGFADSTQVTNNGTIKARKINLIY